MKKETTIILIVVIILIVLYGFDNQGFTGSIVGDTCSSTSGCSSGQACDYPGVTGHGTSVCVEKCSIDADCPSNEQCLVSAHSTWGAGDYFCTTETGTECSFPGIYNCDTWEEYNIIRQQWNNDICNIVQWNSCQSEYLKESECSTDEDCATGYCGGNKCLECIYTSHCGINEQCLSGTCTSLSCMDADTNGDGHISLTEWSVITGLWIAYEESR